MDQLFLNKSENREQKTICQCITLTSLLRSQVMCVFQKSVSAGISNIKTLYFLGEFTFEIRNGISLKFILNFNDNKVFDEHLIRKAKNL